MKPLIALLAVLMAGCASAPKSVPPMVAQPVEMKTSTLPANQQHWTLAIEQLNGMNIYIDESITTYDVFSDVLRTSILVENETKDTAFTKRDIVARCSRRVYTEVRTVHYLTPLMTFTRTVEGDGGVAPFGKVGYLDGICAMALAYVDTGRK